MVLPELAFSTPDLFTVVRERMLTNRGFFAAHDPEFNFYYAMADAMFYDFEVFKRTGERFSVDAVMASSSVTLRAIANGQIFGVRPSGGLWEGEIINAGFREPGDPHTKPDSRYFGKWAGRTARAYTMGRGDPSQVTTPVPLREAMGALLPLIQGGTPFGAEVRREGTRVTQFLSPTLATSWLAKPSVSGKVLYGIHRSAGIIFILAQESPAMPGIQLGPLIALLHMHGVSDAALGDGSDSATMVVDGKLVVTPFWGKDIFIPTGFAIRRRPAFTIKAGKTTFTACNYNPLLTRLGGRLPSGISPPAMTFTWGETGPELTIQQLGFGVTGEDLGLSPFPWTLRRNRGTNPAASIGLMDATGKVGLDCAVTVSGPLDSGTVKGAITITPGPAMLAKATIEWTLS